MKLNFKINWGVLALILVAAFTIHSGAFAADDDTKNSIASINTALCAVINVLQGPMAKGIGTIAIVFLAFGMFMSKVSWGVALATALAIAVIFGAGDIAKLLIGKEIDECPNTTP